MYQTMLSQKSLYVEKNRKQKLKMFGNSFERQIVDASGKKYFLFKNGFSELSNFHRSPFYADGVWFVSFEQYLWAQKALIAKDYVAYQNVMEEKSSSQYKNIRIANLNYDIWNSMREDVYMKGLTAKFTTNKKCSDKLKATEGSIIHATKKNLLDGTGLSFEDDANVSEEMWQGANFLGKALEIVRNGIN